MFRSLILITLISIFAFSCGEKENYSLKEFSNEIGVKLSNLTTTNEKNLKNLFAVVYPKSWKIIKIFKVLNNNTYFKQYLVVVYSPEQHAVFYNYLWLTKDNKFLIPNLYKIENQEVYALLPKKRIEYPLEDISWILNINRIIFSQNLPLSLTKGSRTVYLIWNPYCQKCYENWKKLLKIATERKLNVMLIPYHSIYYPLDNLYSMIYILWRAQKEGLLSVLDKYYSSAGNFEEFLDKLKTDTYSSFRDIPKEYYNNVGYAIESIDKILELHNIFYVPTTIWIDKVDKINSIAQGYIYVNQIRLNKPDK